MNSKFLCISIAAVAMVITTNAPAYAQYDGYNPAKSDRFDGNGRGMRFNFAPSVIRPYGYQNRSNYRPAVAHRVSHGNVPVSSAYLGVSPSLFAKSPPPKPILVPETVVSSGVSFARTQANQVQTFKPEFGRPAVAGHLPSMPQPQHPSARSARPVMLLASKPAAVLRPAASKTARYTQSKSVRGTVVPRKQPTPLIGSPQIANYNDTQLYAPGGVMVRSTDGNNGNANVYGKVLSRSNN